MNDTPAMRQYFHFKKLHPDCVLFFRMGDFYEMFHDDAKLANKVLGMTLTQRTEGIPMAGVPYHAVQGYLRRMIQAGYRVAVCDQVEDPATAKGLVKRDVTRVITPGTLTDETLLEEGRENPLAAVMFLGMDKGGKTEDDRVAVAWAELSTGSFHVAVFRKAEVGDELARVAPRELLYVESANGVTPPRIETLTAAIGAVPTSRPAWQFRLDEARETLCKQFEVATLGGFGLDGDDPSLGPASAIIHYLRETQQTQTRLQHLQAPKPFRRDEHLIIDQVSLRSLEVERTLRSGSVEGSLLGVMQDCRTAMGKRLLRQWLCYPLRDLATIRQRQQVVAAMVEDSRFLADLREALDGVQDVQRIGARVAVGRAFPRDLTGLGSSVAQSAKLTALLDGRPTVTPYHQRLADVTAALSELSRRIGEACVESPPAHLREGGMFRDGYDAVLDECRGLQRDSETWLAQYQKQLIDESGITSLKVGYNKVFGYYIEVSAAHRDKPPATWSRKQTLKNAERYITPELKDYEGKVLTALDRGIAREQALFSELCELTRKELPRLHDYAQAVAELDTLACFARRAVRNRYVCPEMVEQPVLNIRAGRHPVLDDILADRFVPNDVNLGDPATLALITGPNMAGKSTYIRQTALIVLLAHTGSFVPSEQATVGLCDRIFTRIGASDELHAGQSTFMVEMTETANICHHAAPGSLVILDEIGRGTSTLDGLALAWAITEHLAQRGCRTLFATHYHEITALADDWPNLVNLNVSVREWQDQIVFLHRIVPGATDRSYGTHVAKIAGLPRPVIDRANALIRELEVSHTPKRRGIAKPAKADPQMSLFTEYVDHPVVQQLRDMDLQHLTPLAAFDLLRQLQQQSQDGAHVVEK
ncbi:MAG: DNA mismatch repair protein MutS [Phycisphaeraceae bacterium]|nr:DNA mismatch repair protein MutS [Phycisphaeraceae bacterium]